jgi:hypothetical protein
MLCFNSWVNTAATVGLATLLWAAALCHNSCGVVCHDVQSGLGQLHLCVTLRCIPQHRCCLHTCLPAVLDP